MVSAPAIEPVAQTRQVASSAKVFVQGAMEIVVLASVLAGPWMYGAVHPGFELLLDIGLAVLLLLWGVYLLLDRRLAIVRCPVTILFGSFVILSVIQITPVPIDVIRVLSPTTASLQEQLTPKTAEKVVADQPTSSTTQPGTAVFSLYPYASRSF
jgi:hypothetical protein